MYNSAFKHGHSRGFLTRVAAAKEKEYHYDNALYMKPLVGSCVFKDVALENNVHCVCSVYKPKEDFHIYKVPLTYEFFILRIDEISQPGNTLPMVESKYNTGMYSKSHSVSLLSSLKEFTFFASKNSRVKTLEILMPRRWFFSRLPMECSSGLLKKYMDIKPRKLQIDCTSHLFRRLCLNIISEASKAASDVEYLEARALSLLDIFFAELSDNLHDFVESEKVKISKDEISRLINVRKSLDIDIAPPTFTSLTKIALMSSTSLKTKFKKMYGTTVFEYFQSMRMQRARILLLTHKYSVKQIGRQLGYSNLSNFAIAFKKEFNQLPHELIKEY